mgnify:CR=1 FL=1
MKKNNAGFSLIELVVVIAVIVVLGGIGLTWISNMSGYRARECAGKVASTLSGAKVKSLSKQQNTGDAFWELKLESDGKYYVTTYFPNYSGGSISSYDEETSKVGRSSNIKITYTDNSGVHDVDGSNPLYLCYDRSIGALYVGKTGSVNKTSNISKITVSKGSISYNIEIVAKTGKVIGRY